MKLSRDFDHVGEIAKIVGDLRGLRTVVHELIQNSDDPPKATRMTFKITRDRLELWNDDEFSRCSDITGPDCLLRSTEGHRCDFHSFRSVGSGDKRNRPGTTGAFGIGFAAVYQLTDLPELISNGEHWIINEMDDAGRIETGATPTGHTGTTFLLPWATQPSQFRKAIRQQVVTPAVINDLLSELIAGVPLAMPFLKHLNSIEVVSRGWVCDVRASLG